MIAAPPDAPRPAAHGVLERLRLLGLRGLTLVPDGSAVPPGDADRFERALLGAEPFRVQLVRRWRELARRDGGSVDLHPGVTLVPLHAGRPRRGETDDQPPLFAALMLGPEFLSTDLFRLVCDAARLDARATEAALRRDRLVPADQRPRVAAAARAMAADALEIERLGHDTASLSGELTHSYEELSLLYKLSSGMTVNQPPDAFLHEACTELQLVSGMRWTAVVLPEKESRLGELAGRVFIGGEPGVDPERLEGLGAAIMARTVAGEGPVVFNDPASSGLAPVAALGANLLSVALWGDGACLGLLLAGDKLNGSPITSVDSKLCDSLAATLAIFLRNTILFADTQSMFVGTLRALTSAIDAKDSYTHGHSERVALVASMLGEAAGLGPDAVRRVHLSGLVHDVGKIGVPESVLSKPGKLTEAEFEQIKMHPEIGARILQDIPQMHDLIPGVLYHHERWDGRGYPHGLAGEDAPLFGRVIGLADAFDAMSSTRTYRRSLSRDQVIAEVLRCRGSQFDPALAALFVELDFRPFDALIVEHQRLHRSEAAASPPTAGEAAA